MTYLPMPATFFTRRFSMVFWPLHSLAERAAASRADAIINPRARATRFPIRALRYWWIHTALLRELPRYNRPVSIVDAGCSTGQIKSFVGTIPQSIWTGLDFTIHAALLRERGYTQLHQCDFDQPLPLASASADVVIFLHVIEHLPRPAFTLNELARILRPGGLLLAGSPIAPAWIAAARDRHLRRRFRHGLPQPNLHVNSMSCYRWLRLLHDAGLSVELLAGTFFARISGCPLENYAAWARLNLIWGALFPSLGSELCLAARKPLAAPPAF